MTRGFTEVEPWLNGPTLPQILRNDYAYYTAQVNKRQRGYPWQEWIGERKTKWGRNPTFTGQLATRIIQTAITVHKKPWFLNYNLNDPHRPFHGSQAEKERFEKDGRIDLFENPSRIYNATEVNVPGFLPDLHLVRKEMAQYYSSVRRLDDGVGALLNAVETLGQTNHTIVIFLSDNGLSAPFAKINCYQASLRVPFIFKYPGVIAPGQRDEVHMVSAVDIAPTLLDLLGIPIPEHMAGRSFVPLLLPDRKEPAQPPEQPQFDHVVGYYYRNLNDATMYPMFVVHTIDWVYIYNPWVKKGKEVRNSDYQHSLIRYAMLEVANYDQDMYDRVQFHRFRVREELYNLQQDPHSYINVIHEPEHQDRVLQMRSLLIQWMEDTQHPALTLMMDPHNQTLISAYLNYEKCNARVQLKEKERGEKLNNTCTLSYDNSSSGPNAQQCSWWEMTSLTTVGLWFVLLLHLS
jgi:N-sulfoglucosamine sulfohydrolase